MTVYAAHELGKTDVSSALTYGDLRYVNHRYIFADELEGDRPPQGFCENVDKMADVFEPKKDYLLIAGDHLQLLMMAASLTSRYGGFYVLRYDREAKGYIPVLIGDLNEHVAGN